MPAATPQPPNPCTANTAAVHAISAHRRPKPPHSHSPDTKTAPTFKTTKTTQPPPPHGTLGATLPHTQPKACPKWGKRPGYGKFFSTYFFYNSPFISIFATYQLKENKWQKI